MQRISIIVYTVFTFLSQLSATDFNHDYSQTWVSKIYLATPDKETGSSVKITFEQALDLIKQTDNLTLEVPKIVYLVGWQYNGHDDKYPAFFEVNPFLKRDCDSNALESLRWLIREARKYHTAVSLHINMTDAYEDSPLWNDYVEKDLISKERNGELKVVGNYNQRKAYQINYRNEWNTGYTQMRIDKLIEMIPELKESATIHPDAWLARPSEGHSESAITEAEYQKKAACYWKAKGFDITTEWVLDYMIGYIPYYYHLNHFTLGNTIHGYTQNEYMRIPADVCTGTGFNPNIKDADFDLGFLFGTTCYGELIWSDQSTWISKLTEAFMLNCPQYFFLNKQKRLSLTGTGKGRVVEYTDNIQVSLPDSTVTQSRRVLRDKNTICFPAVWRKDQGVIVYSSSAEEKKQFDTPLLWGNAQSATLYEVSVEGLKKIKQIPVSHSKISVDMKKNIPYYIVPCL